MHFHVPAKQKRLGPNVFHQFCPCGRYRRVDMSGPVEKAGQWIEPWLTPRNWRLKARDVLELLEWSGKRGRYNVCPVCLSVGPHRKDCLLDRLLHEPASLERLGPDDDPDTRDP